MHPQQDMNMDLDQLFTLTDYSTATVSIPFHSHNTCGNEQPESDESSDGNGHLDSDDDDDQHQIQVTLALSRAASTDYDLTGQILWPVAVLLSHYIASRRGQSHVRQRNVVELGAGCGLPGLVAAHTAKSVMLTDGNDVVLDLLQRNATTRENVFVSKFIWGDRTDLHRILNHTNDNDDKYNSKSIDAVDVLVAADVVQWPAVIEPLLHSAKALLWKSQTPLLLLGIVNRAQSTYDLFFTIAAQLGFSYRKVPETEIFKDGQSIPSSCQEFGGRITEIYEVELVNRSIAPVLLSLPSHPADETLDTTLGSSFQHTAFLPC